MMDVCASVQTLLVTQYMTKPNCQYRPLSAKIGPTYFMYFCEEAIGLSGSVIIWPMPRLMLWDMVRNVVTALIATVTMITAHTPGGSCVKWKGGSGLWAIRSAIVAPKIFACSALYTSAGVKPYFAWPRETASRTSNSAQNTGSCTIRGRHPISGLAPFSW